MAEMVIVAIPDDRDPVWKISSEKVPHMTLLYLGDQERDLRVPHIAEYVEHATKSSLSQFGMSVERRGELGPKDADVLFFDKNWTARTLEQFRSNLLKDPVIFGMYNSVEQFPQWTPHLTLGYPDAPAKEPEGDERIPYWVEFKKIAFWFDDFEGMEYLIPADDRYAESAVWSMNAAGDFLEHYGVKGMKWGVRNDKGHEGESAKTKKIEKLDKKFDRNTQSYATVVKVYNRAASLTNDNDVDRINNDPKYKDADFTRDSPLRKEYYKRHQDALLDNLEKAAAEMGTNASGTKRYGILEHPDGSWDLTTKEVKHADGVEKTRIKVKYSDDGHILSFTFEKPDDEMTQSDPLGDFLEHYGVKGMKWGVSRTRDQIDSGVQKVKKAYGEREELKKSDKSRPVSDDAQKKSEALRVARNANLDRLSNKELQHLVTRMNLEKQYEGLTKGQNKSLESRAQDFVKEFVGLKAKDAKNTKVADAMSQAFNSNKPEDWRSAL